MDRSPSNLPIDGQSFRRVEVLSGPSRRRRWSDEEKAALVGESRAPGAVARTVALRHGLHPNQLYAWRRDLRSIGVADRDQVSCGFVPVAELKSAGTAAAGSAVGPIEIAVAGMIVRVAPGIEPGFLSAVLRAVKAA